MQIERTTELGIIASLSVLRGAFRRPTKSEHLAPTTSNVSEGRKLCIPKIFETWYVCQARGVACFLSSGVQHLLPRGGESRCH